MGGVRDSGASFAENGAEAAFGIDEYENRGVKREFQVRRFRACTRYCDSSPCAVRL